MNSKWGRGRCGSCVGAFDAVLGERASARLSPRPPNSPPGAAPSINITTPLSLSDPAYPSLRLSLFVHAQISRPHRSGLRYTGIAFVVCREDDECRRPERGPPRLSKTGGSTPATTRIITGPLPASAPRRAVTRLTPCFLRHRVLSLVFRLVFSLLSAAQHGRSLSLCVRSSSRLFLSCSPSKIRHPARPLLAHPTTNHHPDRSGRHTSHDGHNGKNISGI
ncbi:hypothetical protein OH77DRAFT_940570 [Trametes cingulata]|nr:hypothetical protein OH77DRAFT_940570 [Trametes cingulata]